MQYAHPLPDTLLERYKSWRDNGFSENEPLLRTLADDGQSPQAMVISCCDSRVNVTSLFEAAQGTFFVHRNIANFVPPNTADGDQTGTAAALEYAITVLKVPHLIIVGHSACGGVRGCYDLCSGNAPGLEDSFVGKWVKHLRPAFDRLPAGEETDRVTAMEKEAVLLSLENLMGYGFVAAAVNAGTLQLHALWNDIGAGTVEAFDAERGAFAAL